MKKTEIVPHEMSAFMELISTDVADDIPELQFHTGLISGWFFEKKMKRHERVAELQATTAVHQNAKLTANLEKTLKLMTFMAEYQKLGHLSRIEVEKAEAEKQLIVSQVQLIQIEGNDRLLEFTHKQKELADGNTETTDSSD